jgi:RNA polymerase sigma factor (sigma-70 family)
MAMAQPSPAGARTGWVQHLTRWTRQAALSHEQQPVAEPLPPTARAYPASARSDDFEAFFLQYEHAIFGYLMRLTGDEQSAHDLSQEAFLRAWQHYEKIRGYEHPAAWLFRVASNLAISHLRRRASPVGSAKLLGDDDSPARSDPAMRFIEFDLVEQTLLELPPKQRAALVLREVYGFSCEEIGSTLGMSRDAVKMSLWRARERFRVRYARGNAP